MEEDEPFFEIFDSGDFVKVSPIKYKYPDPSLDWDRKWLDVEINVRAGAFSAKYNADLMIVDFESFKKGIQYLYSHLSGVAEFHCLESYLNINLKGDGIGHFEVDCKACDNPGYMARTLEFSMSIDQTQLMPLVRQLDAILLKFPFKK